MAQKGWALIYFSLGRYVFKSCSKGEYLYRIELLKNSPKHLKSREYLQFLEETGITCVTTSMNWVYLRKPVKDGPFNLYSGIDSKIAHYKRVMGIWIALMFAEFAVAVFNLMIGINLNVPRIKWINLSGCVLLFILTGVFAWLSIDLSRKIKRLESERIIRE
ncbi:DUF2812 domain-containing protein [Sporolactobacillus shoreicorticis]|uniref:DUF2812 domain-containing protein n=1 Tax=Sporolactobacillus shoreicorticis TaxID=1923877 RepID=A0ABW5S237_9BACL|nr:DUF2812 domain-containing protein [Sporolactobacillus shoreicorticis]MCO7125901.1 DUF2812 domain-containing protein [Sporolactobacillus shoreicorticis]